MMQHISIDKLLTLGMALYADRRTMEQRVRGIFGRRHTSGLACALAVALCLLVGVTCFTTACVPVREAAISGNAATAGDGASNVQASGADNVQQASPAPELSKEDLLRFREMLRQNRRAFPAPRVDDGGRTELGDWTLEENVDAAEGMRATEAFLAIADPLFDLDYTQEQMYAAYYRDETGHRGDIWRIASLDGVLVGAVEAEERKFISADCAVTPADEPHASYSTGGGPDGCPFDVTQGVERIATALSKTLRAEDTQFRGASFGGNSATLRGWNIHATCAVPLTDGRYCLFSLYGDESQTIESVGICPDSDCMAEYVYWRADLEWAEDVITLVAPKDFRKGTPAVEDMQEQAVYDFYYKFVTAANGERSSAPSPISEPNLTFFVDHSGARENYWHVEGNVEDFHLIFNIASRSGHIFDLYSNQALGFNMGLMEIPYEEMGNAAYIDATRKLFEALFGEGSVQEVELNGVSNDHYCTVALLMTDGTSYEIEYEDGRIIDVNFYAGGWYADLNWTADWIYVNNETGETFHQEL